MAYRQEDEINFEDTARRGTLFRTFRPKITPFWPFLFHDPTVNWIGEDDISLRESLEFEPQKKKWSKKRRLVLAGIILLLLALAAGLITTIILLTKSDTVDPVKRTMNVDLYFNETYKKEYADPENKLTIEKRREITEKIDNAMKNDTVLSLLYTGSSVTELRNGSILAKTQLEFESKIQEIREIQKVASADVVSQSLKKIPTLLVEKSCILWEGKLNDMLKKHSSKPKHKPYQTKNYEFIFDLEMNYRAFPEFSMKIITPKIIYAQPHTTNTFRRV
ncbi:Hypothetical predicted protein [Octopus vulgaris]|uniref:Uncharacterized protein n=1 Tax=Octopus vulgaris TaxID=6645 RepID=A0AA36FJY8_OCTVU|nr:Hypothetical predicted protein [Octopus vulgaris]